MTQRQGSRSHGEMRELYPVAGESYRYRVEEGEGSSTFVPEAEGADTNQAAIALSIESRLAGEGLCRTESGDTHAFAWAWVGAELHLWLDGNLYVFQRAADHANRRRGNRPTAAVSGEVLAPMSGAVLDVLVSEGERVEQGRTVVIMESMKMELVITAPSDGVIARVAVQPGQQVERGMALVELEEEG